MSPTDTHLAEAINRVAGLLELDTTDVAPAPDAPDAPLLPDVPPGHLNKTTADGRYAFRLGLCHDDPDTIRAEIARVFAEDESRRVAGTSVLITEADIGDNFEPSPYEAWHHRGTGFPTFVADSVHSLSVSDWKSAHDKFDEFTEIFVDPRSGARFAMRDEDGGLFVAGGCCQGALDLNYFKRTDIDLFPVLPSRLHAAPHAEQIAWAETMYAGLLEFLRAAGCDGHQSRTPKCATITTHCAKFVPYEIQFILRLYQSPAHVLNDFDLGSCAVGVWDDQFVFAPLGLLAFQLGAVVYSMRRCHVTTENRLVKYSKRGFAIVFPEADVVALDAGARRNVAFGAFTFDVRDVSPETLVVSVKEFRMRESRVCFGYGTPPYQDYDKLKVHNSAQLVRLTRWGERNPFLIAALEGLGPGIFAARPPFCEFELTRATYDSREHAQLLKTCQNFETFNPCMLFQAGYDLDKIVEILHLFAVRPDNYGRTIQKIILRHRTPTQLAEIAKFERASAGAGVDYKWAPLFYRHVQVKASRDWYKNHFREPVAPFHVTADDVTAAAAREAERDAAVRALA